VLPGIVYAGTPEFAVPALAALVEAGYPLRAVLTQPDRPAGRGRALGASAVKRRALDAGLAVLQPETLAGDGVPAELAALGADLFVVAAYGLLLPPAVLALPPLGCVNIHASLLPRWRGAAPVQRALEAGDAETGVAIMRMEAGLDTGPVYAERRTPVGPRETAAELTARLAALGAALLLETLPGVAAGRAVARAQPDTGASYARKVTKAEARIDWTLDAVALDRRIRAFVPWPVAEASLDGTVVKIHEAEPVAGDAGASPGTICAADAGGILVATGAGQLRLGRVQLAGRGVVTGAEFARAAAARARPLPGRRFAVAP
jgi:methionyl-tRNA formyltransferase